MTVRVQCPEPGCDGWARWQPVLLFHRAADGRVADPPASLPLSMLLCDDCQARATTATLVTPEERAQVEQLFASERRSPPAWEHVELSWECEP